MNMCHVFIIAHRMHHVIFSVTVNDSLMNECLIENFINYFLRNWRRFPNHKGAIKICDLKKVTWECDYICPMILIYFFKEKKACILCTTLANMSMICVQNNGDSYFFGFQTQGEEHQKYVAICPAVCKSPVCRANTIRQANS
jgi:hypothetical protein